METMEHILSLSQEAVKKKLYSQLKKKWTFAFSPAKLSAPETLYMPVPHISKVPCAGSDQLRGQMSAFIISMNFIYSTNKHMTVLHCQCEKPLVETTIFDIVLGKLYCDISNTLVCNGNRKENNGRK